MEYFDRQQVKQVIKRMGKFLLYLLITVLIGIFIGLIIAGQNPFLMFWPPTWIHLFEFLR